MSVQSTSLFSVAFAWFVQRRSQFQEYTKSVWMESTGGKIMTEENSQCRAYLMMWFMFLLKFCRFMAWTHMRVAHLTLAVDSDGLSASLPDRFTHEESVLGINWRLGGHQSWSKRLEETGIRFPYRESTNGSLIVQPLVYLLSTQWTVPALNQDKCRIQKR
jgi:hypothetical protein